MYRLANIARHGLRLLAVAALSIVLAGCVINSAEVLVSEGDMVTPLPDTFVLVPYNEGADGYAPADQEVMDFALEGKTYKAGDGSFTAYFEPLDDGTYLIANKAADGVVYGFATYTDNVLEIDVVLGAGAGNPDVQGIPGVEVTEGGMVVADRAALDAVIALYQAGKIEMDPMVSYISADPNADFPSTLTRNGEGWTAE
jgi:hypothetical protein